jgi:hypothetical protein
MNSHGRSLPMSLSPSTSRHKYWQKRFALMATTELCTEACSGMAITSLYSTAEQPRY